MCQASFDLQKTCRQLLTAPGNWIKLFIYCIKERGAQYNVMIITLARGAGENRTYMPGKDGVDPEQRLDQTDPLGLSNDERDLINAAVAAKASNGGKVIVILNNASTMADTTSVLVAIVCLLVSTVASLVASFQEISK